MRYYIETDGRLFLVEHDSHFTLPTRNEIPFPLQQIDLLATTVPVTFCAPILDHHPHHWLNKDEAVRLSNVSLLVKQAIHATMARVVVEGIATTENKILLVKGNRGLTNGRWTLPGGFLRFGESPEEGLLREISEELGCSAKIEQLYTLKEKVGEDSFLHWIMIFYRVSITGDISPNKDEIDAAVNVPLVEAKQMLFDNRMQEVVDSLIYTLK